MNIISRIVIYFLGSVRLELSGEYCERLLNVMAAHSISFWKPKKVKDKFLITVLRKDIMKIKNLRKNTEVKIKFIKKSGFPLIINKYKKRFGIFVGIFLFTIILSFLSSRMWIIKTNGNVNLSEQDISVALNSMGIHYADSMSKIDSDILKQKLILHFKNIAWASVNKQGSVLEINITEFSPNVKDDVPCNLIAERDAIIKKVNITRGIVNVKIGDTVSKNQVLVSGVVSYASQSNFVHSKGEVIAQIRGTEKIVLSKTQKNIIYNGKCKKRRSINIMGLKIPLYLGKVRGNYTFEKDIKNIEIFGGRIPIILTVGNYKFYEYEFYELSETDAKERAIETLKNKLKNNGCDEIDIKVNNITENEKKFVFQLSYICTKNIAIKQPIEVLSK